MVNNGSSNLRCVNDGISELHSTPQSVYWVYISSLHFYSHRTITQTVAVRLTGRGGMSGWIIE